MWSVLQYKVKFKRTCEGVAAAAAMASARGASVMKRCCCWCCRAGALQRLQHWCHEPAWPATHGRSPQPTPPAQQDKTPMVKPDTSNVPYCLPEPYPRRPVITKSVKFPPCNQYCCCWNNVLWPVAWRRQGATRRHQCPLQAASTNHLGDTCARDMKPPPPPAKSWPPCATTSIEICHNNYPHLTICPIDVSCVYIPSM